MDGMHHLTRDHVVRNEGFQQTLEVPVLHHLEGKVVVFRGVPSAIVGNTRVQTKEMSTVTRPQYVSGDVLFCGSYEAALTVSFYDIIWYPNERPIPGYASTGRSYSPFLEYYRLPVLDPFVDPWSRKGGIDGGYWAEVLTGEYDEGVGEQRGPRDKDREETICDRPFTRFSDGSLGPFHAKLSFVYDDTGICYEDWEESLTVLQEQGSVLHTYYTHSAGFSVISKDFAKCSVTYARGSWSLMCNCRSYHFLRQVSQRGSARLARDFFFRKD